MKHFKTFTTAALLATAFPSAGQAAAVESVSGGMFLQATATVEASGDLPSSATDSDAASFFGAPTSLSVTAAAQKASDNGRLSSSISLAANADWSSPDHGTFNFSALLSLYDDGYQNTAYAKYEQYDGAFWHYNFTTNTDAILNFSAYNLSGKSDVYSGSAFILFEGDNDLYESAYGSTISCGLYLSDHGDLCSIKLTAGTNYDFNVRTVDLLQSRIAYNQKVDDSFFLLAQFSFDIVPVSAPPTGGGDTGAVPEPSSWALMTAGFGLAGAVFRRSRLHRRAISFA
jgi:hypothetical protein